MLLNSGSGWGILNREILRDFLVVSSRPCGTFRLSNPYPGLRPPSVNLFGVFFFKPPTKSSSCLPRRAVGAKRLTDSSRGTALGGAESKDPEGAYLVNAFRSFSTTQARELNSSCGTHLMVTGTSFHAL